MAEVFSRLGRYPSIIDFADQRLRELQETVRKANEEIRMWEEIKSNINLCPRCKGYGKIDVVVDVDKSISNKCFECNGTGRIKEST